MTPTFPESSRKIVEKFNKDTIQIVAEFVPDEEYNHETIVMQGNHNGVNRKITPEEMAYSIKFGKMDPSL